MDSLKQAATDIISLLSQPKRILPFQDNTDELQHAIKQTATILHRATTAPQRIIQHHTPLHVPKLPPIIMPPPTTTFSSPQHAPAPRVQKIHHTVSKLPRVAPICVQQSGSQHFKNTAADYLLAQLIFAPHINHIYDDITGRRESIESLFSGKYKLLWDKAVSNEFGRLAHGNKHGVSFTDTITFIAKNLVPLNKRATYASFIFDLKPLK
jgi:hypothetical protein